MVVMQREWGMGNGEWVKRPFAGKDSSPISTESESSIPVSGRASSIPHSAFPIPRP